MVEHERDGQRVTGGDRGAGGGFRRAVRTGGLLFIAGQVAADRPGAPLGDIAQETRVVMELIGEVLSEHALDYDAIVRCGVYVTSLAEFTEMDRSYRDFFSSERLPARTCVQVAALLGGSRVEIDAVAGIPPRHERHRRR